MRGVEQGKLRGLAVFLAHAVGAHFPASGIQHGLGAFHVVVGQALLGIVPRQAIGNAPSRRAIAAQHTFGQFFAIHRDIDGLADGDIGGDVVANREAGLGFLARWLCRKRDAAVVHGIHCQQLHFFGHIACRSGRDHGHVHLACARGGHGSIFGGVEEGHALEFRLVAVVVGVGLHHHLLAFVPRDEFERPRADGVFGIAVFVVGVLGHNAQRCQRVHERDVRLFECDLHRGGIDGLDACKLTHIHCARCLGALLVGKDHIVSRQRLAVGEFHAVTDGDRPGFAVLRQLPLGGQIALQIELRIALEQGGLEQWVAILAPALDGVKALIRLAPNRQHQALGRSCAGGRCR